MKTPNILDDRHEIFNMYKSLCTKCRYYDDEFGCAAFPDGIPDEFLSGEKFHTEINDKQHNDIVFEAI